jgi:hypothetical protein
MASTEITNQEAVTAEVKPILGELERLLQGADCPSCRYVQETERSFFSWFQIESFSVAAVQAQLRASMGMCPRHSRRLVEELGEGHITNIVAQEALAGARQRLRDECQPGPCPACAASASGEHRARQILVDGLSDSVQARAYVKHAGICFAHFLRAVPAVEQPVLGVLAERLLRSVLEPDDSRLVNLLAGDDPDAAARASCRARLPDAEPSYSTLAELRLRLESGACPACLAVGLGERGYVRWFLARTVDDDPSLETDPGELCFVHLHDLALADRSLADAAVERKRTATAGQVQRLIGRLAELPAPARRSRRNAGDGLDRAREGLTDTQYCPACHARDGIERSQLELVAAGLAVTPIREAYERGHGLCVRHAMQMSDGQAARIARRHLDGRLGVLAWEVHETARKYAWAYRHELGGPEQSAWLRALAQIDGRVLEGGPAPPRMPTATPERS